MSRATKESCRKTLVTHPSETLHTRRDPPGELHDAPVVACDTIPNVSLE